MRYRLITIIDWLDDHIIQHRFYKLCELITYSSWWGEDAIKDE